MTETIDPVLGEAMGTLIKLVDRVRMLDNDLIRLNMKLAMVLEYRTHLDSTEKAEMDAIITWSFDYFKTDGVFYTDSNGLGMIKREKIIV